MADCIIDSGGAVLKFTVQRNGDVVYLQVAPQKDIIKDAFNEDQERYIIGVTASGESISRRVNLLQAFSESLYQTYFFTELTVISVIKMIQGIIPAKEIGGPILIAQVAGKQVEEGFVSLLLFIAIVSINLGILNLLPVPVLDGGHILFFMVEAVFRKPLSIRTREIAQQIGIFLLMMLMVFAFYNDIMRLFTDGVK